jgi:hypothetical protein
MTLSPTHQRQLREHPGAAAGRGPAHLPSQRQPLSAERTSAPPDRLDGLGQVTALVRDGFAGLPSVHRSPRLAVLWAFWLGGIIGDAATTLAMISSGRFEEGNPAAAAGMGFLGLSGYIVVASLVCLFFATVSTGRPRGPVAVVAVGFLLLVGVGKWAMAVSNLTLWASLR